MDIVIKTIIKTKKNVKQTSNKDQVMEISTLFLLLLLCRLIGTISDYSILIFGFQRHYERRKPVTVTSWTTCRLVNAMT